MDQVGQTTDRVGKGAGRSAQLLGWPARVLGGSARAFVATRLHEEEKPELVEAAPPSRPATNRCQTDLSKSVEVPFPPITPHGESQDNTLYL
jgi:hypothetical protein